MKFCNYTNFDALFPSVAIDFPFLCLNQYFEIAKFVYYLRLANKITEKIIRPMKYSINAQRKRYELITK